MAEPEEVILEGARLATKAVADLWRRNRVGEAREIPELADVRQRVELYVAAICAGAPRVVVAEPPVVPGLLTRLLRGIPGHLAGRSAVPSTDGARIRLPRRVDGRDVADVLDRFRLLALEQAVRATRGTPDHLPADPALRDLYLLSEAAAIDRWIAAEVPGLRAALVAERRRARAEWPPLRRLTGPERTLEQWLLALLDAPLDAPPAPLVIAATPEASLRWAESRLATLIGEGRYRGLPPVPLWGRVDPPPLPRTATQTAAETPASAPASDRSRTLSRRPRVREADEGEDDERPGMEMVPTQDRQEKAEDPMGLSRPLDRDDDADLDELADSLEELPEARLVPTNSRPREVLASDDPPESRALVVAAEGGRIGVRYPEWDYRRGGYRLDHVTVWVAPPALASAQQAEELLRRNRRVVDGVRRRFEGLKPRRVRRGRQLDGPDVDLDAFVASLADRRAGGAVDDRLYEVHRPLRRDLALSLLVDVSASTDAWVAEHRRIIDVERDALLVVAEALDALGDRYAILTFSGQGPRDVAVTHLKDYGDGFGPLVRRRIAALEPQHFTRLGAALRHATAGLAREGGRHRLLLLLSDGKPNDVDEYEGRYGIEDARQAVAEARRNQIHLFCLTVDREAPAYMPRIFGPAGFATLHRADALPRVLVDVIRRLISA